MKAVFYLTDEGLTCYKENESLLDTFKWEEIEPIELYLTSLSEKTQVSIVMDVMDEDIYFEWAPKLLPWEKKAFLDRRKARFESDEFILNVVQWTNHNKESDGGRKEELLLISLLANNEVFSGFLTKLEEAQILVTHLYSKPFLLVDYFKNRVRPYLKWSKKELELPFLVVSRLSEYTFRQIFLYEGQLRISRLVELEHDAKDMMQTLVNETKLAVAYVRSQNLLPVETKINLLFLDSNAELLKGLFDSCKQEGIIAEEDDGRLFNALTFNELSKQSQNYSCEKTREFSQPAMVDFILNDKPNSFYSNLYIEKIKAFIVGRQLFIGINVLLLLGGLYYIVISGVDSVVSWEKQGLLEQKILEHQIEIKRLNEVVKFQDDAQHVKASVEFSEAVLHLKLNRVINFDIQQWSVVFARHEQHIHLLQMDWKTLNRFDSRKSEIILTAWVFPFYDSYEDPVQWVDDFVEDFKGLPSVESVELQEEPLNRDLSQPLIIEVTKEPVDALPFTVKIRVKDVEPK